MPEFSVVTIVKGRRKQLANLLYSVNASTILPSDVQIVCMDDLDGIAIPNVLNVKTHLINEGHKLPLAAARNLGITACETNKIIFIDADCIVSSTLFENMLLKLETDKIIVAYPLYLSIVPDTGNFDRLKDQAIAHPAREHIPPGQPIDHLQFWSLIFAINKETFEKIGGFDEGFVGYGAEDTDFAMMFRKAGVEQIFISDYVLHQYHNKYNPPLNYFESIIKNATRYREKWGVLPMQHWLKAFENLNLITINDAGQIIVKRHPNESEINDNFSKSSY